MVSSDRASDVTRSPLCCILLVTSEPLAGPASGRGNETLFLMGRGWVSGSHQAERGAWGTWWRSPEGLVQRGTCIWTFRFHNATSLFSYVNHSRVSSFSIILKKFWSTAFSPICVANKQLLCDCRVRGGPFSSAFIHALQLRDWNKATRFCQVTIVKEELIVTMNFTVNKAVEPGGWRERNVKTGNFCVCKITFLDDVWKLPWTLSAGLVLNSLPQRDTRWAFSNSFVSPYQWGDEVEWCPTDTESSWLCVGGKRPG